MSKGRGPREVPVFGMLSEQDAINIVRLGYHAYSSGALRRMYGRAKALLRRRGVLEQKFPKRFPSGIKRTSRKVG